MSLEYRIQMILNSIPRSEELPPVLADLVLVSTELEASDEYEPLYRTDLVAAKEVFAYIERLIEPRPPSDDTGGRYYDDPKKISIARIVAPKATWEAASGVKPSMLRSKVGWTTEYVCVWEYSECLDQEHDSAYTPRCSVCHGLQPEYGDDQSPSWLPRCSCVASPPEQLSRRMNRH